MTIVTDEATQGPEIYTLEYLHVISGTSVVPSATVKLRKDGQVFQDSGVGDGPVDAVLAAINAITGSRAGCRTTRSGRPPRARTPSARSR